MIRHFACRHGFSGREVFVLVLANLFPSTKFRHFFRHNGGFLFRVRFFIITTRLTRTRRGYRVSFLRGVLGSFQKGYRFLYCFRCITRPYVKCHICRTLFPYRRLLVRVGLLLLNVLQGVFRFLRVRLGRKEDKGIIYSKVFYKFLFHEEFFNFFFLYNLLVFHFLYFQFILFQLQVVV